MSTYKRSLDRMVKTARMFEDTIDYTTIVEQLNNHHIWLKSQRGERIAVQQLKAYYNEGVRYVLGESFEPTTPLWVKRSKGNLPKIVNQSVGKLLNSNILTRRRLALSFLRCYEAIQLKPVEDLSTIVEPSEGNANFALVEDKFDKFLHKSQFARNVKRKFIDALSRAQDKNLKDRPYLHFTSKSGVGGPSIQSAGYQSLALDDAMIQRLRTWNEKVFKRRFWTNFVLSSRKTASNGFDFCSEPQQIKNCQSNLGRILFLSDKGGKTRLVAVGSYWIQDSLKQLHHLTFKILRGFETDGTFYQEGSFENVLNASKRGPVWSFDLTAATDRIPLGIQTKILKYLDPEMGSLWEEILNNLTFQYGNKEIRYQVGQPMGLYGSWAFGLALTHHFIIQYCAYITKRDFPFNNYAVLGDDVAIWDKDVAECYNHFMVRTLCVKISEFKSFIPKKIHSKHCNAEFAKRISNGYEEITPISPLQSSEAWNNLGMMPSFITWLQSRGYELGPDPVSTISRVGNYNNYYKTLLEISLHLWKIHRGIYLRTSESIPGHLSKITIKDLVLKRTEMFNREVRKLMVKPPDYRVDVEKSLGTPVDKYHYMLGVLNKRYQDLVNLQFRVNRVLASYNDEYGVYPTYPDDYRIDEIEFAPYANLKDILNLKRDNKPNKLKFGQFITSLAKVLYKELYK